MFDPCLILHRCNYSRLLNQQGSELQALDDSHSKYQSMLEQYSKEQDAMFAKQRCARSR